jgi:hypothetical protein
VEAFLSPKFHPVFYRIKMDNKMTSEQFKQKLHSIVDLAKDLKNGKIVIFVDEFNATSIMGLIKEVFMDHTIDGVPLPRSLLWVGAMNPSDTKRKLSSASNFTGIFTEAPEFIVRSHPPSMDTLILNFDKLTPGQEKSYLKVLLDSKKEITSQCKELGKEEKASMIEWISQSQDFVRILQISRMHLSIRGIKSNSLSLLINILQTLCEQFNCTFSFEQPLEGKRFLHS